MGIFGFILIFGGILNKHLGFFIGGLTFSIGSGLAFRTDSFIPLIIALIIAIILRKLGFDPSARHNKQMSDVELLEKALPEGMKRTYTVEEVKKGFKDLKNDK